METGILITRPEPGAAETARRITALGLTPVVAPLLSIRDLPARLPDARSVQAIVVASGHAVGALAASHRTRPLLAVGDATAERARDAGFSVVHSAGADAAALAMLAASLCDPEGAPLLLVAASGQSLRLAAELRRRGFRVLRRTVYATAHATELPEPARRALLDQRLRAALFFSAGSARVFVKLLATSGQGQSVASVAAVAIAQPTASVLAPLPWRALRVAERPNQDDMLALIP